MSLREVIAQRIRLQGPLPLAEYMNLALYHPELGYYTAADRRSGRAGDFYTSVDVGPLFGELLTSQLVEMCQVVHAQDDTPADHRFAFVQGRRQIALHPVLVVVQHAQLVFQQRDDRVRFGNQILQLVVDIRRPDPFLTHRIRLAG